MSDDTWFGVDRTELALFLGVVCFGALYWRASIFITDNETLVRTLQAVSDGRLWIELASDGPVFEAPGAEVRDGRVYGRNYGQIVASLPALAILGILDAIADIRIALVAVWHLAVLGLVVQLARIYDTRWITYAGSAGVLVSFLLNLSLATTLRGPRLALLALGVTSLVASGLLAVVVFRLLAFQHDRRLGVLAGAASVVVLPVGFWAPIPKRHVFTVLACFVVLYLFALSRESGATHRLPVVGEVPTYRAGAYATVALLTWVHAGEGLFVFLALVAVDLPTAPRNDRRTLAFIAGIFVLAMVPTVVTNFLVTGHPATPPRALAGGIAEPAAADGGGAGGGGGGGTGGGGTGVGILDRVFELPVIDLAFWASSTVGSLTLDSVDVLGDPDRLWHVFVRSAGGEIAGGKAEFAGTNLSVLEAAPVLAGLAPLVVALGSQAVNRPRRFLADRDPTSVLAVAIIVSYLALYLSRLPLWVQITQRYILPVFPLALYLMARSETVRSLLAEQRQLMLWSYTAGVLLGTQLFVVYVVTRNVAVAEAAQANAQLSLLLAVFLGVTMLARLRFPQVDRPAAIALGLACAAGTIFLLVSGIQYFSVVGEFVLPAVEALSKRL